MELPTCTKVALILPTRIFAPMDYIKASKLEPIFGISHAVFCTFYGYRNAKPNVTKRFQWSTAEVRLQATIAVFTKWDSGWTGKNLHNSIKNAVLNYHNSSYLVALTFRLYQLMYLVLYNTIHIKYNKLNYQDWNTFNNIVARLTPLPVFTPNALQNLLQPTYKIFNFLSYNKLLEVIKLHIYLF